MTPDLQNMAASPVELAPGTSAAGEPFRGRVLYFARAPFVSGAERAMLTMLRHLDRSRIDPSVVLGCETAMVEHLRALNIPVIISPMPKRGKTTLPAWWGSLRRTRRAIRHFNPDLLHANDVPSCQAMSVVGAQLNLPRVVHVHWGIAAADAAWFARGGAEAVVCITRWVRDQLGDPAGTALAGTPIHVAPSVVDWPAEEGEGSPIGDCRLAIDKEEAHPRADSISSSIGNRQSEIANLLTLGFAGQLIESKGLDLVIEAMGRVCAADSTEARLPPESKPAVAHTSPDLRLLVAGKDTQTGGRYEQHLRDLAARAGMAGRIEWLGFIDDVAQLHRSVDAMVCPSRVEPQGLVPLEAARLAVPTLANRVGGLTDMVVDGQTGRLIDPTVEAWAEALATLPDRATLRQWGRAAHQRTREHFGPAVQQQALMAIYARAREDGR